MAIVTAHLDTRSQRKDSTYPVKIKISHKGDTFFIATNIHIPKEQWSGSAIINNPQEKIKNQFIRSKIVEYENALLDLAKNNRLQDLSCKEIKEILTGASISKKRPEDDFLAYFGNYANTRNRKNTQDSYLYTLLLIKKSAANQSLKFADIDYSWLQNFNQMMLTGKITSKLAINTASIHMRNIRAVFNDAINSEITEHYPFRKFKIKGEKTPKRSLSIDDIRRLRDFECEEHEQKYRDIFMLVFYMVGINLIDLLQLKEITQDGRVEYRRSKTSRLYSIKVEKEAMEIINRYRGEGYLLSFLDDGKDYKNFFRRLNKTLKEIGVTTVGRNGAKTKKGLFPEISTYWARHTWATIAAGLDVPKETIAAALGHGGNEVTDIYISFDQNKIDDANRKVIEAIK